MKRIHQFVFTTSLLALCWFAMMAVHELGHVVGAFVTGGIVQRVVLHPLTISRTDVAPNPFPLIVVWLGPILGCVIPTGLWVSVPKRFPTARTIAMFFAGFCLLANGAYIAFGAFDRVGDCGVMLQNGSPTWLLVTFGVFAILFGLLVWHGLGSVKVFLSNPSLIEPTHAYTLLLALSVLLLIEFLASPF